MVCLRRVLVLEGQPQLGAEDDLAALLDIQVLLHHLSDTQVTERLACGVHRSDRRVFPGLSARPDDVDDPVHAHGILLDCGLGPGCHARGPGIYRTAHDLGVRRAALSVLPTERHYVTAMRSMRLASAVEAARLSSRRPRTTGSSRTAHSSRQLVQAMSRASLILQLPIRVATALRC